MNSRWIRPLALRFAEIPPPPIGCACKFTCDQACNYIYPQSRPLCVVFTRSCIICLGASSTNFDMSWNSNSMVCFLYSFVSYFVNQYFFGKSLSVCCACCTIYLESEWRWRHHRPEPLLVLTLLTSYYTCALLCTILSYTVQNIHVQYKPF